MNTSFYLLECIFLCKMTVDNKILLFERENLKKHFQNINVGLVEIFENFFLTLTVV